MSYIAIDNFRFGVDKRKSEMTANIGTLAIGQDGVINEGGEFEKRKALTPFGDLSSTFGFCVIPTGFAVFGSGAQPGNITSVPLWLSGPVVTYLRCQHPDGVSVMTKVIHAVSFGGGVFVVAQFAQNGISPVTYDVLAFYQNITTGAMTLVEDFVAGLVMQYMMGATYANTTKLALAFSAMFPPDWTITDVLDNTFKVQVPAPQDYKPSFTYLGGGTTLSMGGMVSVEELSPAANPSAQGYSVGSFQVVAGSVGAGNAISSVALSPSGLVLWPSTYTSLYGVSVVATATEIARVINYFTLPLNSGTWAGWAGSNHSAVATGNVVLISQGALTSGPGTSAETGESLEVTCTGDVCIDNCAFTVQVGTAMSITSVSLNGDQLLSGAPYSYPGGYASATLLCAAVVADINSNTIAGLAHGILAYSSGNTINLSRAVSLSTIGTNLAATGFVTYVGTGGAGITVPAGQLASAGVTLSSVTNYYDPTTKTIIDESGSNIFGSPSTYALRAATTFSPPVYAYAIGFTPVAYQWSFTLGGIGSANQFVGVNYLGEVSTSASASIKFTVTSSLGYNLYVLWGCLQCQLTDVHGNAYLTPKVYVYETTTMGPG